MPDQAGPCVPLSPSPPQERSIYLDQNIWIAIARVWHGKDADPEKSRLVERLTAAVDSGALRVPLSHVHFVETARRNSSGSRERLAHVMWTLSRGITIAGYPEITRYEIQLALSRQFDDVPTPRFQLYGTGWHHAFGQPTPPLHAPAAAIAKIADVDPETARSLAADRIGGFILAGIDPDGSVPGYKNDHWSNSFADHLKRLGATLSELPRDRWDDALMAMSLLDIREPITSCLTEHALTWNDLWPLGRSGLESLLLDMPTRRADLHLHRQFARNPQLRSSRTDLNDWSALVPATMYCDVVVCEQHFADLIRRDSFATKAMVITDLRDLGNALS